MTDILWKVVSELTLSRKDTWTHQEGLEPRYTGPNMDARHAGSKFCLCNDYKQSALNVSHRFSPIILQ